MDIALLTTFLAPFLPFLKKLGEKASEKVGEKFGEDAWNKAKAIWSKLHPEVETKEDLKVAVEQVAAKPESEARKAVLQEELETLLKETPDLAAAIAKILQGDAAEPTASNQSSQAIGQMSGGTAIGNVQGAVFNIAGSSITNLTGSGDIHSQETSHQ